MSNSMSSNQPWSIDDLIENAPNWNLAGDANLLKYLESFSEDLLVKASETNENLNSLLDSLNSTSLSLDLVKNEFSSLHNNQFIESRVYEDDETIADKEEQSDSVKTSKQTESEKAQTVQEAVMRGIEVVNKYFEKVDVPDSDSEEETDFPSFVLRPKDPYIDRPLPFVIGTDEWHNKWHVGLLDSSSEGETEKVSDKYSDSDSDDDLPIKDRTHTENSYNAGSDADLSSRLNLNRPVANSTFDDSVKRRDIFESSDSEEYENSVPAQTPISNSTFAQELAAKLGNVIEQNPKIVNPEVNTKPIQPIKPTSTYGNIFNEEPPPLDDENDDDGLFGNSNEHDGLFSGRGALFDDLNDDLSNSWSKNSKTNEQSFKPKPSNLFDDEATDIFNTEASGFSTSKKSSGGLFDEDDAGYSDNDLFTDKPIISTKPLLQPYGPPTIPYFDDKPPEFEPVKSNKDVKNKKPIGGVKVLDVGDLFGNQTIGSILKSRKPPSLSDDSTDEDVSPIRTNFTNEKVVTNETVAKVSEQKEEKKIEKTENKKEENVTIKINPKQISLFDDDDEDDVDELFKDDLFSDIGTKKFTSSLFDDDDDILKSEDVFSESFKSSNNLDSVNSPLSEVSNVTNETKEETASAVEDEIIFDQPPAMDDDWDTASEHNLFEPSSVFSESSGIIRDSNTTRIETDDSFNPNICSSRRFSYDNYNEEQSNDSLFIKNKPSSESQSGQYITSIPEVPEEASTNSMIDITPSGNPDNLYSELEITKLADENGNSKNLDNNLFEPSKKPVSPTKVLENSPEILEKKETPKVASKPTVAKKPNSEVVKIDTKPKELKIGKLKHNLNINVSALMPGVAPPRRKEVQTPTSPKVISETEGEDLFQVKSPTSGELDFSRKDLEPTKSEKDPDQPEVLSSITKDRVKIAVKRRPSTRKARQESIRNSMTDFKLYLSTEIPDREDSVENKQNILSDVSTETPKESVVVPTNFSESPEKSSVLPTNPSELKFEELFGDDDLFANTSSIEDDLFGKNNKVDTSSLFDDSLESSTSLFDEKVSDTKVDYREEEEKVMTIAPSTTTVKQTPSNVTKASSSSAKTSEVKKVSLFDDSEEFDDIFSTAKLPSKTTSLKKSLFDDDDDDDLFGPTGASQKLDTKMRNKVLEKKKGAPVKKLENTKVVDDPLSFFND